MDSGASGNFMDTGKVYVHNIPPQRKGISDLVGSIDKSLLSSSLVTQMAPLIATTLQDHQEILLFSLIHAPHSLSVLSIPELVTHYPCICLGPSTLHFTLKLCCQFCLPKQSLGQKPPAIFAAYLNSETRGGTLKVTAAIPAIPLIASGILVNYRDYSCLSFY